MTPRLNGKIMDEAFERYAGYPRYFCPPRCLAHGAAFTVIDPDGWTTQAGAIDWICARQLAVFLFMRLIAPGELDPDYWRTVRAVAAHDVAAENFELFSELSEVVDRLEARVRRARGLTIEAPNEAAATRRALNDGLAVNRGAAPAAVRRIYPVHPYGIAPLGTPLGLAFGDSTIELIRSGGVLAHQDLATTRWAEVLRAAAQQGAVGLFDGVAGELFCLALATDGASEVVELLEELWDSLTVPSGDLTIWSGVPGVVLMGLVLLQAGLPLGDRTTASLRAQVQRLNELYRRDPGVAQPHVARNRSTTNLPSQQDGGLFHGHLGWAWLFARASATYDDVNLHEGAVTAARHELITYEDDVHGGLQRRDGRRALPYLATGSAGFGAVLDALGAPHLPDDLRAAAVGLDRACRPRWATYPGLFNGHAGLVLGQVIGRQPPTNQDLLTALRPHVLPDSECAYIAGDAGFRVTCDVATGSAGLLLALRAVESSWTDPLLALVAMSASSTPDVPAIRKGGE